MSELYRHLLIPRDAELRPEPETIAAFFTGLAAIGALPLDAGYTLVAETGKTRPIARNAKTGEVYYGPELKVSRYVALPPAIDSLRGEEAFRLGAEGQGPAPLQPFALYGAHHADVRWDKQYMYGIRCVMKKTVTHYLHSPFGCSCDLSTGADATFENPWNDEKIETNAKASVRFWIEFGVADYLMPMITSSLDILDPRLIAAAQEAFGVEFAQGCICNDD